MAIAALILGIVSIVIGFIPLCGSVAILPAIVGIVLAIIDIVKKSKKKEKLGMSIAGLVLSALAIFFIIFLVFVVSVGSEDTSANKDNTRVNDQNNSVISVNNEQTKVEEKTSYNVGETYSDSGIKVTFVSCDKDFRGYSKYATVKEGHKVIKATFEFTNLAKSDEFVTTGDFDCFADDNACDMFYSVDDTLSANLSSGKKVTGSIYYEVPVNAKNVVLEYETNFFSDKKVVFNVK